MSHHPCKAWEAGWANRPTSQAHRGDQLAKAGPQVSRLGFHCALLRHSASTDVGSKGPMLAVGWECPVTICRMARGQFSAAPAGLFNSLPSPSTQGPPLSTSLPLLSSCTHQEGIPYPLRLPAALARGGSLLERQSAAQPSIRQLLHPRKGEESDAWLPQSSGQSHQGALGLPWLGRMPPSELSAGSRPGPLRPFTPEPRNAAWSLLQAPAWHR